MIAARLGKARFVDALLAYGADADVVVTTVGTAEAPDRRELMPALHLSLCAGRSGSDYYGRSASADGDALASGQALLVRTSSAVLARSYYSSGHSYDSAMNILHVIADNVPDESVSFLRQVLDRGAVDVNRPCSNGSHSYGYRERSPESHPPLRYPFGLGWTPLMIAARAGKRRFVDALLRAGARPPATFTRGMVDSDAILARLVDAGMGASDTIVMRDVSSLPVRVIRRLLANGARRPCGLELLDVGDVSKSLLHQDLLEEWLLEDLDAGRIRADSVSAVTRNTALHAAAAIGSVRAFHRLLQDGGDLAATNRSGEQPHVCAAPYPGLHRLMARCLSSLIASDRRVADAKAPGPTLPH
jgi:Ankyrin repeat